MNGLFTNRGRATLATLTGATLTTRPTFATFATFATLPTFTARAAGQPPFAALVLTLPAPAAGPLQLQPA